MKNKIITTLTTIVLLISIVTISKAGLNTTDLNIQNTFSSEDKISSIILPIYITDTSASMLTELGYSATLEYDENVFESVTFSPQNSWSGTYNDTNKAIVQDTQLQHKTKK